MKNNKVIICVGIPASGKSTWAKEFVKNNKSCIRINRDDIRQSTKGSPILSSKGEEFVTMVQTSMIDSALMSGYDIIIDNTNVKKEYIDSILEYVKYKADVEFEIFFISKKDAIERDSKRLECVGPQVINRMYQSFVDLIENLPEGYFSPRKKITKIYSEKTNFLPKAVVFDIDGTLAHMNGKRGPFDFTKVHLDDVDSTVREHTWFQRQYGRTIIIVSGRDDSCWFETKEWLNQNMITHDFLFMRNTGDQRKDSLVKEDIYNIHIKDNYNVVCWYDDRQQVVDHMRKLGVKVFQVEEGKF